MQIGSLIRKTRENKNLTREHVAKRLKISKAYLSHLENNDSVYLSENLATRIIKTLAFSPQKKSLMAKNIKNVNKKAHDYYKAYRKKQAKKRKK